LGGRRRLRHEGERPVFVDRDLDRNDVAALTVGGRVVLPDEVHDVDAVRAKRRTDRRCRRRRTSIQLGLYDRGDLLLPPGHLLAFLFLLQILLTWLRSCLPGRTTARPGSRGRRSTPAP